MDGAQVDAQSLPVWLAADDAFGRSHAQRCRGSYVRRANDCTATETGCSEP